MSAEKKTVQKKVLQVTAALSEGGVERGTLEMARFTISKGVQSHVASNGGKLVPSLEAYGAFHHTLPLNRRDPFSVLYCAIKLAKLIRTYQIDLVHARSRAPAWSAFIASKFTSTPFITTFHGTHKIQNYFKWLYNSSMVRGRRVIAISQFIKAHIIDNYHVDPGLIDVAPRGVNVDLFSPQKISAQEKDELRTALNIQENELLITLPGRLTRWKGQTVFIEALSQIKDLDGWKALLVGGCGKKVAYEQEIKDMCERFGLLDKVVFAGSQMNMPLYYAISDVVVSASTEPEAFGRVAVEAQAMEKPIVATQHGGSLETVRDGVTGWFVAPDDSRGLADLLRKILFGEIDLEKMGALGRDWVVGHYTEEKTCEGEWASYEKIFNT